MHILPIIGASLPFTITLPLPYPRCLFNPSAYPIEMIAILEGRSATHNRLYPTVSPRGMFLICDIFVVSRLTGFRHLCTSGWGAIPYNPMPRRTISICASGNRIIPDELSIWHNIFGSPNCFRNDWLHWVNLSICIRVKSSISGSSLHAKWEKIDFTFNTLSSLKRRSPNSVNSSCEKPKRCIPVSSSTWMGTFAHHFPSVSPLARMLPICGSCIYPAPIHSVLCRQSSPPLDSSP